MSDIVQFNFRMDKNLKLELKKISLREQKSLEKIITEQIENYVKVHGDGNPSFELDKWIDQPTFKSDPAFRRARSDWQQYIENIKDERELNAILNQAQSITSYADKKLKYGTTNVINH